MRMVWNCTQLLFDIFKRQFFFVFCLWFSVSGRSIVQNNKENWPKIARLGWKRSFWKTFFCNALTLLFGRPSALLSQHDADEKVEKKGTRSRGERKKMVSFWLSWFFFNRQSVPDKEKKSASILSGKIFNPLQ